MVKFLSAVVCSLVVTGCATQTFYINEEAEQKDFANLQGQSHFFLFGVGQENTVNAAEVCGGADKVVKVQSSTSVIDGVIALFTSGLYTPESKRVYCSK
ncbi:Bor protein [Thalassolituus maritimus]|uniref:Bor protein n=1 Tax=Thalassolituus maritimus TaxID=484498 RepID=A0A1N7NIS9_9GAMM|nr:Bor family protein [Thalassolituus maritimus]SIS98200.1 Bor protein [Thalassolituus maritimus]